MIHFIIISINIIIYMFFQTQMLLFIVENQKEILLHSCFSTTSQQKEQKSPLKSPYDCELSCELHVSSNSACS